MKDIVIKEYYIQYDTIEQQNFLIDLIMGKKEDSEKSDVLMKYARYPYGYFSKQKHPLALIPTISYESFIKLYNEKRKNENTL